jgi:putative colanic acid biosynthesis acetyltransferase WcaF
MVKIIIKILPGLKNYSYSELALRVLWGLTIPLFRITPRHLYFIRNSLLILNGAKIGDSVRIYPNVSIINPHNLYIGHGVTVGPNVILYALGKIMIGSDTVISQYSHLCAGTHDYQSPDFKLIKKDIRIGSKVWVAADSFIGPDVSIGDYSVIAARSVVVRSVESGVLVGGNPARILKRIRT